MNRTLDYFVDFLDNPQIYNDREYRKMLDEWVEYVLANRDNSDVNTEEWTERRTRTQQQVKKRFGIPKEVQKEFKEIKRRFKNIKSGSDAERIQLSRDNIALMKKYQHIYNFSDADIEKEETNLANYLKSIENHRQAVERLKQAKIDEIKAYDKLEQAMFDEYERTGKPPIVNINVSIKKKHEN